KRQEWVWHDAEDSHLRPSVIYHPLRRFREGLSELIVRRTSSNSVPRRALYRYVDWRDKRDAYGAPFSTAPPADLRYRVHGDLDVASFLETGKQCASDIQDALARVDKDIGSFERILDFGCGCARTLLWLAPWADRSQFSGTD